MSKLVRKERKTNERGMEEERNAVQDFNFGSYTYKFCHPSGLLNACITHFYMYLDMKISYSQGLTFNRTTLEQLTLPSSTSG